MWTTQAADGRPRKIVRTLQGRDPVQDLPVVQLFVVASCVIRGKIVELRLDCGQMFAPQAGMERHFTHEVRLAEQLQATIREEAIRVVLKKSADATPLKSLGFSVY